MPIFVHKHNKSSDERVISQFGADIVCEKQTLLYMFYAGDLAVLLFKNPF